MTNTIENKAKFFALYWGQPVMWCMGGGDYERLKYIVRSGNMRLVEKSWLELTPLSQISDEDAIEVAKQNKFNGTSKEVAVKVGKDILRRVLVEKDEKMCLPFETSDFLRSRGYALPWMGLAIETLVEYGWVKLKG